MAKLNDDARADAEAILLVLEKRGCLRDVSFSTAMHMRNDLAAALLAMGAFGGRKRGEQVAAVEAPRSNNAGHRGACHPAVTAAVPDLPVSDEHDERMAVDERPAAAEAQEVRGPVGENAGYAERTGEWKPVGLAGGAPSDGDQAPHPPDPRDGGEGYPLAFGTCEKTPGCLKDAGHVARCKTNARTYQEKPSRAGIDPEAMAQIARARGQGAPASGGFPEEKL